MRNKFTDLIKAGVAAPHYVDGVHGHSTPITCPIVRYYNNVFSIPSDTHMSIMNDGRYVITGSIVATPKWDEFMNSLFWGAVSFYDSGARTVGSFLYRNGFSSGHRETINGEIVYVLDKAPLKGLSVTGLSETDPIMPVSYNVVHDRRNPILSDKRPHVSESASQPLSRLTTSRSTSISSLWNPSSLYETAKSLNESAGVKGDEWYVYEGNVWGIVDGQVVRINCK